MAATTMTSVKNGSIETAPSGFTSRQLATIANGGTEVMVHNYGTGHVDGGVYDEREIKITMNGMDPNGHAVYISAKDCDSVSFTEPGTGEADIEVFAELIHSENE